MSARGAVPAPAKGAARELDPPPTGDDAEAERVLRLLLAELPLKTAVRLAAEISGAPRNALYEQALALKSTGA